MSILASPTRYSRATPSKTVADLIAWQESADGIWTGRIDLDFAGSIVNEGGRYVAANWNGEEVGNFRTLRAAKESLEPRRRMALRERAEHIQQRTQWMLTGSAAVISTVALVLVANGVILTP